MSLEWLPQGCWLLSCLLGIGVNASAPPQRESRELRVGGWRRPEGETAKWLLIRGEAVGLLSQKNITEKLLITKKNVAYHSGAFVINV